MKTLKDLNNQPTLMNVLLIINKIITIIFLIALIVLAYFLITQPDNFIQFFDDIIQKIKSFFNFFVKGYLWI